jgi:hypothetical protein
MASLGFFFVALKPNPPATAGGTDKLDTLGRSLTRLFVLAVHSRARLACAGGYS